MKKFAIVFRKRDFDAWQLQIEVFNTKSAWIEGILKKRVNRVEIEIIRGPGCGLVSFPKYSNLFLG